MKSKIILTGLIIFMLFSNKKQSFSQSLTCWNPLDSAYTMGFEDIELAEFNLWTLNDDNYDEQNWDRLQKSNYPHSGSYSLITRLYGDWAVSPCFYLEQGKEYEISFWHFTADGDLNQNLILAVGDSAKGSRMSDTLLNLESLGNTYWEQLKAIAKFTPISTGTYYFGWKADGYSSWGTTRISIDDIEIKEFACTASVDLGADDTICEGSSKQLDAGAGFVNYIWKRNNVQVGTERYFSVDTVGEYKVEVKDQFDCPAKDSVNIYLFSYPEVLNVIADGDTVICDKDSVMLSTNLPQDDIDNSAIKWYEEDTYSSVGTGATYKAKTPGYYYYKVEHNNFGCKATSNSKTVEVKYPYSEQEIDAVGVDLITGKNKIEWGFINQQLPPVAKFILYKENEKTDQYLILDSVNFTTHTKYTYIDTSSYPEVKSDKYKISIKDDCGHESSLSEHHKTIHLNMNVGLGNKNNLMWDNYEGKYYNIFIIKRSVNQQEPEEIAVIPSTVMSYTDINPVQGEVNYYVVEAYDRDKKKGKAEDKLISTSNKVASDKVGINEQGMEIAHLYIYPNPASDRLNVEFTMLNAGKVDIRLLDITGREIAMILDEERATGKNNVAFNLGNIDKGIYFIKITAGGYNITRKVVKN